MESQRELDGSEALEGKLVVVVVEEGVVELLWVAVPLVAVVPEPPLVVSQVVAELAERLAGVVPSVYCRPQQIHWFYLVLHFDLCCSATNQGLVHSRTETTQHNINNKNWQHRPQLAKMLITDNCTIGSFGLLWYTCIIRSPSMFNCTFCQSNVSQASCNKNADAPILKTFNVNF